MQTDSVDMNRTVVVSGVPKVLPDNRMLDKLIIHFQKRNRSNGGDVEVVQYPTNMDGVAFVTFDSRKDAERVLQKEEQIMSDEEFPADYVLTVFPFSVDVFVYVSTALVDLSVFGSDQTSLIQSLQSAHRSLRFRPLPQQRKATIQGPFTAVQALRRDLIHRADRLKPTDSAQTSQETPLNPRVISHPEFVDTVSCGRSRAKPELVNGLSTGLQTTGEATGVQSQLFNAKTVNAPPRLKVQERGFAEGRFSNTDRDEGEEESSQARGEMQTEFRDKQKFKEEKNTTKVSENGKQQKDNIRQKKETKKETQSSSATSSKLYQTRHKDVSNSSKDAEKNLREMCTWVDLNAFLYIEKFAKKELDDCLRGLKASFEKVQGSDLVRVILTQTSKATSGVQRALERLQLLVESWMITLRVHEIDLSEEEGLEKKEVMKICNDGKLLYDDILCIDEGSCIKIIGPPVSSHLYYRNLKRGITKLKEQR